MIPFNFTVFMIKHINLGFGLGLYILVNDVIVYQDSLIHLSFVRVAVSLEFILGTLGANS